MEEKASWIAFSSIQKTIVCVYQEVEKYG